MELKLWKWPSKRRWKMLEKQSWWWRTAQIDKGLGSPRRLVEILSSARYKTTLNLNTGIDVYQWVLVECYQLQPQATWHLTEIDDFVFSVCFRWLPLFYCRPRRIHSDHWVGETCLDIILFKSRNIARAWVFCNVGIFFGRFCCGTVNICSY